MALLELAVQDLALIERARLSLGEGLTVITGETGAGKSLLIDALGLVAGGRADTSMVRAGATNAHIEALFDRPEDIDGDASEPMICVRELAAAGRTVARIDDQSVSVARLAAVVEPLIAIHGQHEQQRLLSAARQLELLDGYAGLGADQEAVAAAVAAWRENRALLVGLDMDPAELERRLALARHVVDEVAAIEPRPGEVDELRGRLAVLDGADRAMRLADSVRTGLVGEGSSIRDQLARTLHDARDLARLLPVLDPVVERLAGLEAEAVDVADEVRVAADGLEADLGSIAAMQERLSALYSLLRKHGDDETAVLEAAAEAAREVERLGSLGAQRADRQAADGHLRAAAEEAADRLSAARQAAAGRLEADVTVDLRNLGFPAAAFQVQLERTELTTTGVDALTFLLAPNPGEPPRPLARIASGGELSRVSLAIEQVLATADTTPTLVFDEVDAGIGGRSADPVGHSLWRLARHHQVLCVTHLPQIAVHADAHLHIAKETRDGRTVTSIRALSTDERVAEIAAMLGGADSDAARDTARELLVRAHAAHPLVVTP